MTCSTRRVRFEEGAPESHVDCQEFSEDEIRAYWLRTADFFVFERNRKATIRTLRRSRGDFDKIDPMLWCYRGMEEVLNEEYACRMANQRSSLRKEVLDEQERQRQLGAYDDNDLREISTALSEWARMHALELGRHDARVAETGKDEPIPLEPSSVPHGPETGKDEPIPFEPSSVPDGPEIGKDEPIPLEPSLVPHGLETGRDEPIPLEPSLVPPGPETGKDEPIAPGAAFATTLTRLWTERHLYYIQPRLKAMFTDKRVPASAENGMLQFWERHHQKPCYQQSE
jgi:hypothetical protein